jgi:uncharacterized protein
MGAIQEKEKIRGVEKSNQETQERPESEAEAESHLWFQIGPPNVATLGGCQPRTAAPPSVGWEWSMNARRNLIPTVRPQFAAYDLGVRRSRIHGYGVYARQAIAPRRKVIEYSGERLTLRQAIARCRKVCGPGGSKHLSIFRMNRSWLVDGAVGGSGAELVNHCCDPNLKARIIGEHILLFSRRRIRKGEELTLDYMLRPKHVRMPCHCGSRNCRGTINRK